MDDDIREICADPGGVGAFCDPVYPGSSGRLVQRGGGERRNGTSLKGSRPLRRHKWVMAGGLSLTCGLAMRGCAIG